MASTTNPNINFRNVKLDSFGIQWWDVFAMPDATGLNVTIDWPDDINIEQMVVTSKVPDGWTFTYLADHRKLHVTARAGLPLVWTQLGNIAFMTSEQRDAMINLSSLQLVLEESGCQCRREDDYIIATASVDWDAHTTPHADIDDNKTVLPQTEFIVWYDRHSSYMEKNERLLRVRISIENQTRTQRFSEAMRCELAYSVNGGISFGRFNAKDPFFYVQWDCFIVGPLEPAFLQKALINLATSARVATRRISRAEERLAR